MELTPLPLDGPKLIKLQPYQDSRGSFCNLWSHKILEELAIKPDCTTIAVAQNNETGTLRGLHYQKNPYAQSKLVFCLQGAIFDVLVDLRENQDSFGQHLSLTLDANHGLFIPKGFAHGYQTLSPNCSVLYLLTGQHQPSSETGYHYNSKALGISWPKTITKISKKDTQLPQFQAS